MNKILFNVISLDSEPQKINDFMSRNQNTRFEFEKFTAIDGRSLDKDFLTSMGVIASDLNYATGALGCAMSHISLWHRAKDLNSIIHIAEDDATFRFDLYEQMNQHLIENPDFDIIYWGYNRDLNVAFEMPGLGQCMAVFDQKGVDSEQALREYQHIHPRTLFVKCLRVFGILCYSISPKGAQKLIDACLPLRPMVKDDRWSNGLQQDQAFIFHNVGVDVLMGIFFNEILSSYLVFPPLAISLNTLGPPSTTQTSF
jgi:GR25 family glycosyltransferase involved in LPS biosynthesis